jgi:hypothetical protein
MSFEPTGLQRVLATLRENVENAKPRTVDYGKSLDQVREANEWGQGVDISAGLFDYTPASFASGIPFPGSILLPWRGAWLAVDRGSVGTPSATFLKEDQDGSTVTLTPGSVFKTQFDGVRLFYQPTSLGQANFGLGNYPLTSNTLGISICAPNIDAAPKLRVFYGTGECPFESSDSPFGSDTPSIIGFYISKFGAAASPPYTTWAYACIPGAVLDVDLNATRVQVSGSPFPLLSAQMEWGDSHAFSGPSATADASANFLRFPDFVNVINDTGTTPQCHFQASWRNVNVPRSVTSFTIRVKDIASGPDLTALINGAICCVES